MSPATRTFAAHGHASGGRRHPLDFIPESDALRQEGQLSAALEICAAGLATVGNSVSGRLLLARILYDMGKYDLAEVECQKVLDQSMRVIGARKLMIQTALRRHQYVRALELLETLRDEMGMDPDLVVSFAEAQRGLGEHFVRNLAFPDQLEEETEPLVSREELLAQIRERPEVLGCEVVSESGEGDWAEMISAWSAACEQAEHSPILVCFLETKAHSVLVRRLGDGPEHAVVRVRSDATLGRAKHLVDLVAKQTEETENASEKRTA